MDELQPNMGADGGGWTIAKKEIATALQELTSLWYVGIDKRRRANANGVYRWSDPRCTVDALGVNGEKRGPVLQAILDINRSGGPAVCPKLVAAAPQEWRDPSRLEFYVDFETVSDMDDDFTRIPDRGGQPMIFMIGCGHLEGGQWQFRCFTAEELTEACEASILNDWVTHMHSVRARLGAEGTEPLVIHWSKAETSSIRDAYNAAIRRHPSQAAAWSTPRWFDFLTDVVRAEPVVVRGAWGFGLKKIAQAMWQHGLIQTRWDDGPTDGLGAMVGAWWCAKEAAKRQVPLIAIDLMQSIGRYNEVDCKAMMEIVQYLRSHHLQPTPVPSLPLGAMVHRQALRAPVSQPQLAISLLVPDDIPALSREDARIFVHPVDARAIDAWNEVTPGNELVLRWLKQEGDPVALDETVARLEGIAGTVDLTSPVSGTLTKIRAHDGEVAIDAVLGLIELTMDRECREHGSNLPSSEETVRS